MIVEQPMARTISPLTLIYCLLAGPVIWFAHFLLVWSMAEFGCRINFSNLTLISPANIQLFVVVTTALALLAVAAAGVVAYGGWRKLQAHENEWVGEDRLRFLVVLALLLSALFVVSIVFTAAPAFFLDICDLAV